MLQKIREKESKKSTAKFKNNTIKNSASILDAHKTASKVENPLILLTFPWCHLLRMHNTTQRTPFGVLFALVAEVGSVPRDRRSATMIWWWAMKITQTANQKDFLVALETYELPLF